MALASASAKRVAERIGAITGEQRKDDSADFHDCEKSDAISGTIGIKSADDVAFPNAELAQSIGQTIDVPKKVGIGEQTRRIPLRPPSGWRLGSGRRPNPFIQAIVDDVHLAVDAPLRPGEPGEMSRTRE